MSSYFDLRNFTYSISSRSQWFILYDRKCCMLHFLKLMIKGDRKSNSSSVGNTILAPGFVAISSASAASFSANTFSAAAFSAASLSAATFSSASFLAFSYSAFSFSSYLSFSSSVSSLSSSPSPAPTVIVFSPPGVLWSILNYV